MIFPNEKERNIGWFYWAFQLLVLPTLVVSGSRWLGLTIPEVWLNICFFTLNLLIVLLIFFRYFTDSLRHFVNSLRRNLLTAATGLALYLIGSALVNLLVVSVYPNFINANNLSIQVMLRQEQVLMTLCTVLFVPIAEEILYRGLVFGHLRMNHRILSYILSTAIFCGIHVTGYLGSYPAGLLALSFLQYIPAGVVLAWSYERSGTICTSILIHIAVNAIGILAMR